MSPIRSVHSFNVIGYLFWRRRFLKFFFSTNGYDGPFDQSHIKNLGFLSIRFLKLLNHVCVLEQRKSLTSGTEEVFM